MAVSSFPGPGPGQLLVRASLDAPARLTVRCSDGSGREVHERTTPDEATEHEVRLSGLVTEGTVCMVYRRSHPDRSWRIDVPAVVSPLPTLEVTVDPSLGMTGHYTLGSFVDGACDEDATKWLGIWDAEGRPRWWQPLPDPLDWIDVEALWDDEIGALVWGGGAHAAGRLHIVDVWDGVRLRATPPDWSRTEFHHDGKRLPDGRLLTLEERWNVDEAGTTRWKGFGARLLARDGHTVAFEIDSQRYVDDGLLSVGDFDDDRDPYHANWVDWVNADGRSTLFVSACRQQDVLAFDGVTGDWLWAFGAGRGWSSFDSDGAALSDDDLPQCVHGVETDGTRWLVYDNGRQRGESSVAEWVLEPDQLRATRTWTWTEANWFEETLGDVDELPNGRVLITHAHPECWSSNPGGRSQIVEVDRATGRVASRMTFPSIEHAVYRTERYGGCDLFPSLVQYCPER